LDRNEATPRREGDDDDRKAPHAWGFRSVAEPFDREDDGCIASNG